MPISSLLNNLIGSSATIETAENERTAADCSLLPPSFSALAMNSRVNERSDGDSMKNVTDLTVNFITHEKLANQHDKQPTEAPAIEINVDKTFLKCINYHSHDSIESVPDAVASDAKVDPEDNIERVLGASGDAPCLICTNKAPVKHSLMNVLCKKLCDDSCNTSTKTCQSLDDIVTQQSDQSADHEIEVGADSGDAKVPVEIVLQRSNSSRQEFLASMLEPVPNLNDIDHENDRDIPLVAPLTIENLKQFNNDYFREKLAIAEALTNTSMMTSPAAKRRLAARKIEMSLNTPDFVYDPENAEYIPPKELLMYLVR